MVMSRCRTAAQSVIWACLLFSGLALCAEPALAGDYADTIALFRQAGMSAGFFRSSCAYAVFPAIGKGGLFVGAARGTGRVYQNHFFPDAAGPGAFRVGKFALGAHASAIAITASASASASTAGTGAGASGTEKSAVTLGHYQDGMAVFTIAKGGLMYEAAVAGQKFSYRAR